MPRPIPVWGFPAGYDPNEMGDLCEICRSKGPWLERKLSPHPVFGDMGSAWTCAACTLRPRTSEIPLD